MTGCDFLARQKMPQAPIAEPTVLARSRKPARRALSSGHCGA
jgi:hypothetical protein